MKGIAIGHLGWSLYDWEHKDVNELYIAQRYLLAKDIKEWERTRFLACQIVNISGKQAKRDIKPWEILRLPNDRLPERKIARFSKLDREALKAKYEASGIYLEEWELDRIIYGK